MQPTRLRDCNGGACCGRILSLNHSTLIVVCETRGAENGEPNLTRTAATQRQPTAVNLRPSLAKRSMFGVLTFVACCGCRISGYQAVDERCELFGGIFLKEVSGALDYGVWLIFGTGHTFLK